MTPRWTRQGSMLLVAFFAAWLPGCGSGTDQGAGGGEPVPVNLSVVVPPQFLSEITRILLRVSGPDLPVPAERSVSVNDLANGQVISVRIPAPSRADINRTIYVAAFNAADEKILSGSTSGFFAAGQTIEIVLRPTFRVEVRKQGSGDGTVTSTPAGLDCGPGCAEQNARFDAGASVTLTASAASGSVFAGWSGAGCSGTGVCLLTGNATVVAVFNASPNAVQLIVTKSGTGTGVVTSNPGGINCGGACSANFPAGTTVVLAAAPSGNATFTGWSGACSGTGSCTVVLNGDRTVNAEFTAAPATALLTVNRSGDGTVTSDPAGIACGTDCAANFASGSTVTLTATPAGGATFLGWGGACSGTGPCVVTMNGNQTVTATFTSGGTTLTVNKNGTGTGTVTSSPGGINCGTTCSATFPNGTTVTLTATPTGGSTFAGWGGACSGTGACVVTMNGSQTVTATFDAPPATATLTVTKTGGGTGTVTSSPAGIECGNTCNATFTSGGTVTLTATPTGGSTFAGWSGACSGTGSCVVTMNGDQSVTAAFNQPVVSAILTVNLAGSGTGTVTSSPPGINCGGDCTESYGIGTPVTLTATPAPGSTFVGWSGGCGGTGTCDTVMISSQTIVAQFEANPDLVTLSVNKSGPGDGTVTSSPTGINCGPTCQFSFARGSTVTLTAVPDDNSDFDRWSGACEGGGSCVVAMSMDQSVNARFEDD